MQSVLSDLAAYNHAPTALAVPDLAQQNEQRGLCCFPDELPGYAQWERDTHREPTADEEAAHYAHWQRQQRRERAELRQASIVASKGRGNRRHRAGQRRNHRDHSISSLRRWEFYFRSHIDRWFRRMGAAA
ncbi:MAG TPA: hypothetical protein VFC78_11040 [Tepidisphaeraceae bacterium]|nr:hypothetical protein [Tepidisphaeraceae bacterium]